jgi:hypothetical protein
MNQISFKKIAVAVLVVFALSRTRQILRFLEELDLGGILTVEPLRNSPEGARFLATVALGALAVFLLYNLLSRRK